MRKSSLLHTPLLLGAAAALVVALSASEASACGGFFCSASQPVNQAAERIVFANNGDGTVTAVIQILYQGPSENFSWLLPISTILQEGDIGIASNVAFARLQAATNPQYTLTTRFEGECIDSGIVPGGSPPTVARPSGGGGTAPPEDGGVTVESSGTIGQFEWEVISLDASLADPAAAAVTWLEKNGYDVSPGSSELLGPYLADGMYLLALRLTKGSDSGSIRPISLTYEADKPMIPIKLTAVAANDDMGVMTWVLGEARAVPFNYLSLELNEAKINWFNAAANYNDVVTAAADEANGQGFVTEFAGSTESLVNVVWPQSEEALWTQFQSMVFSSFSQLFQTANAYYGAYDGFWDAVRSTVILPEGLPFEDFKSCPSCYGDRVEFPPSQLFASLETNVIDPLRDVQELLDSQPYVTRLYSTLSAAEMTVDPLFSFNSDLEDLSNVHNAERVIECSPGLSQFSAPWRIELPQGGVIRGTGQEAQARTWPAVTSDQPSNRRIVQLGESGDGKVAVDNTKLLSDLNADRAPVAGRPGTGGSGGSASPSTGGAPSGAGASATGGSRPADVSSADGGCAVRRSRSPESALLSLFGLVALAGLVRRRQR
jgi:hypothetical protein